MDPLLPKEDCKPLTKYNTPWCITKTANSSGKFVDWCTKLQMEELFFSETIPSGASPIIRRNIPISSYNGDVDQDPYSCWTGQNPGIPSVAPSGYEVTP